MGKSCIGWEFSSSSNISFLYSIMVFYAYLLVSKGLQKSLWTQKRCK